MAVDEPPDCLGVLQPPAVVRTDVHVAGQAQGLDQEVRRQRDGGCTEAHSLGHRNVQQAEQRGSAWGTHAGSGTGGRGRVGTRVGVVGSGVLRVWEAGNATLVGWNMEG